MLAARPRRQERAQRPVAAARRASRSAAAATLRIADRRRAHSSASCSCARGASAPCAASSRTSRADFAAAEEIDQRRTEPDPSGCSRRSASQAADGGSEALAQPAISTGSRASRPPPAGRSSGSRRQVDRRNARRAGARGVRCARSHRCRRSPAPAARPPHRPAEAPRRLPLRARRLAGRRKHGAEHQIVAAAFCSTAARLRPRAPNGR